MKKILLLSILSLKFLCATYTAPNTSDWASRFNSNNDSIIPGTNVVWVKCNNESVDIFLRNTIDVYGVQFEFEGVVFQKIKDDGFLKENNFEVSHNDKMLLSFSFQGKSIPPGEHKIASVDVDYILGKDYVSMKSLVMAGKGGTALDFPYYDINKKQITARTIKK